jgi:hypothetical protein
MSQGQYREGAVCSYGERETQSHSRVCWEASGTAQESEGLKAEGPLSKTASGGWGGCGYNDPSGLAALSLQKETFLALHRSLQATCRQAGHLTQVLGNAQPRIVRE